MIQVLNIDDVQDKINQKLNEHKKLMPSSRDHDDMQSFKIKHNDLKSKIKEDEANLNKLSFNFRQMKCILEYSNQHNFHNPQWMRQM